MAARKPKTPPKPPTPASVVYEDILGCVPRLRTVIGLVADHGLSAEAAQGLYDECVRAMGRGQEDPLEVRREILTEQSYSLLREALADRDHRSTVRFLDMINRVLGTYAPERHEVSQELAAGPESEERLEQLLAENGYRKSTDGEDDN